MSTEVGTAYVAIIPSAKGFARTLQKSIAKEFSGSKLDTLISEAMAGTTVRVPVRPEFNPGDVPDEIPVRPGREPKLPVKLDPLTKALQDDVRRELSKLTRDVSAKVPVSAETDGLRSEIAASISQVEASLSAKVPTEPAARREYERQLRAQVDEVSRTVRAHITADVDVDVDKPLRDGRVDAAGDTVGRSLAAGILSSLTSGLGLVSGPVMFAGVIAAAVVAAPLVGAALTAGILGGLGAGVIGVGIAALAEDPDVKKAAGDLGTKVKDTLAEAAAPLKGPLLESLRIISDLVTDLSPSLKEMFAAVAPVLPSLTQGLADFVTSAMPGILEAVKASVPLLESLAYNLGPLGETVGQFLTVVSAGMPAAIQALNVLIDLFRGLILTAGALIYALTATFGNLYDIVAFVVAQVKSAWATITAIFTTEGASVKQRVEALVGGVLRLFSRLWGSVTGGASAAIASVGRTFGGLGGRIKSAVGNLGGLLFQAGRNVVNGLIGGLRSMFGSLGNTAGSLAGIIRNYLPFSPAKEGPLSGRGNPFYSGRSIVELLASGVTSNLSTARSAASGLAGAFELAGSPLAAVPASGYGMATATPSPAPLVAEWVGGDGDPIMKAIREHTRIYYRGSAQAAFGS